MFNLPRKIYKDEKIWQECWLVWAFRETIRYYVSKSYIIPINSTSGHLSDTSAKECPLQCCL